jgi:tetratricopeptide (TPR) repeat protein
MASVNIASFYLVVISKLAARRITISLVALSLTALASACPSQTLSAQNVNTSQSALREHINSGNRYLSQLAFDLAIKEYEEALKIDPENRTAKGNVLVAHNNWGIHFAHKKKYSEALEQFEKVLQLDPNFGDARRNIALVKRNMEREAPPSDPNNAIWDPSKDEPKAKTTKKENKSGAPKQEEEPQSAVILTPGIKSSKNKEEPVIPNVEGSAYGSNLFNTKTETKTSTEKAAESHSSSQTAVSTPPQGGTLEDQITAVEVKVYGHKQTDMPVFKRLEKLEVDTAGAPRQGTIKDRIEHLKQNFGL